MFASAALKSGKARLSIAAGLGLLLAFAFPKPGIAILAWLVPGLWLLCAQGLTRRQAFAVGYAGGLAFNLTALYWLNFIPYPVMPTVGWLALSAYLALYPAAWLALCAPGGSAALPSSSLWRRTLWALKCAVVWVALELVLSRLLTGFPWLLLGNSQSSLLPLVQLASITGVAGLSFLIVWFSAAMASTLLMIRRQPGRPFAWLNEMALPLLAVAGVVAFGFTQLMTAPATDRTLKLALIQPSIPQTVKWDADANQRAFAKVLDLSRAALELKPDVLIWPEAVTPGLLRYNDDLRAAITGLAREHQVWMVLGADDAQARPDDPDTADYFNSAFLISPAGELVAKYDKQRLVIFGEYVPLAKWLPFLKWFTPVEGGFTPGEGPVPFQLTGLNVTLSTLICFEDVFGFHVRPYVGPDTDFLLNLTNDGWFGESAAQWQHATMAVFRAVENGVPMVRATNNGLTCWVDARGRMHEVYFGDSPDIYGAGFKLAPLPLPGDRSARGTTFYQRHGDWIGWVCVIWVGLGLVRRVWRAGR